MIVNLSKAAEMFGTTRQNLSQKVNGKKNSALGMFKQDGKYYRFQRISSKNVIVFVPDNA